MPWKRKSTAANSSARVSTTRAIQRKKRSSAVTAARYKMNPVLKQLVDKRINMHEETKSVQFFSGEISKRAPIIGIDVRRLLPEVYQAGVAGSPDSSRDTRVGQEIRVTSITVEGVMRLDIPGGSVQSNTQFLRMFVFSAKAFRDYAYVDAASSTTIADSLLKSGRTLDQYDGTVQKHFVPVNTADITTHLDRKYKSGQRSGLLTQGGLELCLIPFKFHLKCKNKVLKYSDTNSTHPSNYAPFISIGFCDPVQYGGSGQVPPATFSCAYQFVTTLNFKD